MSEKVEEPKIPPETPPGWRHKVLATLGLNGQWSVQLVGSQGSVMPPAEISRLAKSLRLVWNRQFATYRQNHLINLRKKAEAEEAQKASASLEKKEI